MCSLFKRISQWQWGEASCSPLQMQSQISASLWQDKGGRKTQEEDDSTVPRSWRFWGVDLFLGPHVQLDDSQWRTGCPNCPILIPHPPASRHEMLNGRGAGSASQYRGHHACRFLNLLNGSLSFIRLDYIVNPDPGAADNESILWIWPWKYESNRDESSTGP